MKKLFLMISLASAVAFANAQDMNSKRGTPILPEANDWSVGISLNSFAEPFLNLNNGTSNSSTPAWAWTWNNDHVITFKMMKDENTAYRAKVRIGINSNTSTNAPDTASGSPKDTSWSSMNINLGAGLQMYRGKGRLKGYYGAEVGFGIGSGSREITYNGTAANGSETKRTDGSTFNLNLNGFLGCEYFFAPKMSVSGEFTWGLMLSSTGEGTTSAVGATDVKTGKTSKFSLDTDNVGGAINFNLYF